MLDKYAVFHKPYGSWAYYLNDKTVRLVIRTKKNNVKKVVVEYYDKYENVPHSKKLMTKRGNDKYFDYYYTDIVPPHKRLCYFFILTNGGLHFYKQYGFSDSVYEGDFQMPYINPCDVYSIPSWINKAVFYQIFPDSFNCTNKTEPVSAGFNGGTINGITEKLPYLIDLGINAIYLNPIFVSDTPHRYNTIDYFNIDPSLGTKEDFKRLVKKCHENGIKIVLDAVLNHSSNKHEFFLDVLKNGKKSKYLNYYVINSFNGNKIADYDKFAFEEYMPKWNTSNPETADYLISILTYWTQEFGVDGWRFDVGNEIGSTFIRHLRYDLKNINPDIYLLGEIWHDAHNFLLGEKYDGVTAFTLRELMFKYYTKKFNSQDFVNKCNRYYYSLPKQALIASSNFLCNHDTTRVASEIENLEALKNMIATQFMLIGSPLIYYGEEIGMTHSEVGDKGARSPMEWENTNNNELKDYYKKLIALKSTNECLSVGEQRLYVFKKLLIITRINKNNQMHLVVNNTKNKIQFRAQYNFIDEITGLAYYKGNKIKLLPNSRLLLLQK